MGIDQAQPAEAVARLADAALRLRAVREAQAHFLAMWRIERELELTRPDLIRDPLSAPRFRCDDGPTLDGPTED